MAARFSRRQVLNSFRRFDDLRRDVDRAKPQSWLGNLEALLSHCEKDPVMSVVTAALNATPIVDVDEWVERIEREGDEGVTLGLIRLPGDGDDQTAFLYHLLKKVVDGSFNYLSFCFSAFGSRGIDDIGPSMNSEFVHKLTREVSYKLKDIEADVGEEKEVAAELLTVFNVHGPFQQFLGGVSNSVIGLNSTQNNNKLTQGGSDEFAAAVKDLSDSLTDVIEGQRDAISGAFSILIEAIEKGTCPKPTKLAAAVEAIHEGSPSSLGRLKGIVDGTTQNVLADAIKSMIAAVTGGG